jgi:hypothetical protein
MKWIIFAIMLITTLLIGCAHTVGIQMQSDKLEKIKFGITTEADLIQWFGSPTPNVIMINGNITKTWVYYQTEPGVFVSTIKKQILSVTLDMNNIVINYFLIDNTTHRLGTIY